MDNAKNAEGHTLDEILYDIQQKGYATQKAFFITNLFKKKNLKEFFKQHHLNIVLDGDNYIFTPIL